MDHDTEALAQFINEKNIEWPQIMEKKVFDGKIVERYNVAGIPRTYLIDPEGRILAKDLRGERMIAEIEKHLDE